MVSHWVVRAVLRGRWTGGDGESASLRKTLTRLLLARDSFQMHHLRSLPPSLRSRVLAPPASCTSGTLIVVFSQPRSSVYMCLPHNPNGAAWKPPHAPTSHRHEQRGSCSNASHHFFGHTELASRARPSVCTGKLSPSAASIATNPEAK
jgi:hypothetical protein